ncbi:MAG: UDP-N-acetylmuramate--L-alanine ligase [Synergistaceae bacterium]|jgi:UDP-N-acetylmuramate--alanine ligase|nr:UDP-N-acetylmuramate--L-alanine ligase [Synergistaceae bacterium]
MVRNIRELEGIERIHLMGIGGAGMSALALLLSGSGFDVSGCDLSRSEYAAILGARKIECVAGHSPSHAERFSPQLAVYSSAIDPGHEELVALRTAGAKTEGRGRVLSWLFNAHRGIGVAGAHGKSTTSSMIALILERAGCDPTVAVGAEIRDIGVNACCGKSDLFVAEIDESDGSFEFFSPAVTAITNVDWDHVNYFHTRQDVLDAFIRFARGRRPGTPLVVCAEDEGTQSLIAAVKEADPREGENIVTCGWGKSWTWGAFDLVRKKGGGVVFSVAREGQDLGRMELAVSGDHNVMNALVACAVASSLDVPFESVLGTLREFRGARHRLQKVGRSALLEVDVVDDYGHHPAEISATLSAMRDIYPEERLVVVFQPHRHTRTSAFYRQIASSLETADVTLLLPVYSAGEKPTSDISSRDICEIMEKDGARCALCRDEEEALSRLDSILRRGDVLLTLGAGSISHLGEAWLEAGRKKTTDFRKDIL